MRPAVLVDAIVVNAQVGPVIISVASIVETTMTMEAAGRVMVPVDDT
jgi:hypothetical protein